MFPPDMQSNVRNQMYLASEALRLMPKYGPADVRSRRRHPRNYRG